MLAGSVEPTRKSERVSSRHCLQPLCAHASYPQLSQLPSASPAPGTVNKFVLRNLFDPTYAPPPNTTVLLLLYTQWAKWYPTTITLLERVAEFTATAGNSFIVGTLDTTKNYVPLDVFPK